MAELVSFSFISKEILKPLLKRLVRARDKRKEELSELGDQFGDPEMLAKYYVEPNCQHHNPADYREDEAPISYIKAPAFTTINEFLQLDTALRGGATQMFILADAGMGKTSLLLMLKLTHLMAFWPKGYDCLLLKLGTDTLERVRTHKDKARTLLLLDALDEDPLAWGNIEQRLIELLQETENFRRVIISCRTQFFPEAGVAPFKNPGRVEVGGYVCPMLFLSLFDDQQVDAYVKKRFPDRWHQRLTVRRNPKRDKARALVASMRSLRFRPLLLAHIEKIIDQAPQQWNSYSLHEALVQAWLLREERKLRRRRKEQAPTMESLWEVCIRLAANMQEEGRRVLDTEALQTFIEAVPAADNLSFLDVGGRSLLNKNAEGAFRFSHYSVQEFLVVHGLLTGGIEPEEGKFRATTQMLEFLRDADPSLNKTVLAALDLAGLPRAALAGVGVPYQDRLLDETLGPEMVVIPAGTFLMGSRRSEERSNRTERPQHEVTIAKPFALGKYLVTFQGYDRFASETGRELPDDMGWGRRRRPVINVSWDDAVAYAEWLSEQTGKRYRLPTEAEWEYAARAGTKTRYCWGDEIGKNNANCNGCGSQWDGKQTAPVGSFKANPWGLHDTAGNVWEWVQDCWHESYKGAPADGSAWEAGEYALRVVRGGSWSNDPGVMRSACRRGYSPVDRLDFWGFRLAQNL